MRPRRIRTSIALGAAALLSGAAMIAPGQAAGGTPALAGTASPASALGLGSLLAPVSPYLDGLLPSLTGRSTVLIHGDRLADAERAVRLSGMTRSTSFDKIGVVAASGTRAQIMAVRAMRGISYVEGNAPIELFNDTSNTATRGKEAIATRTGADGGALDGSGVSVAVIDSGVDPTHPYFAEADGSSAVVANLKTVCVPATTLCTVQALPDFVDTDTTALGGHGTHVSGIVAGRPTTLSSGETLQGAAPGAKLVSISTGAVLLILGADSALNWVLENHEAPCGAGVSALECPPIKVTNNSYGPTGGGDFDPQSATAKLQQALAAEGVVTVWANGNDGGDGSENLSNPPGQDPTGGVISVASYNDQDSGTRDGTVSTFSSRGLDGTQSTYPDLSAPGDGITSSCRLYLPICATGLDPRNGPGALDLGTFNTISGTSMAAPHIAGIVAQLFQADPDATPAEVEAALKSSAYKYADGAAYEPGPLGTTSYDKGYGLVDVVAAVDALN
ncbi:MAG: S8 family serine peptidase [Nocardioides sp.]|uniref:S8 family serine peptidase n=1 Tax=Nocardioides sp. TaxID=35761 RepID=UPI00239EF523|nr:S8 family serine peptidase [Nocardioides sp.]MDE0778249.1 S8 family serine peptidase [Nocardioides sp.]